MTTVTLPREVVKYLTMYFEVNGESTDERNAAGALRAALDAPAQTLQDSEQYRMQMAGICTAAQGYWKPSDDVHPDYDTPALREVAALYIRYSKLFQAIRKACDELGVPGEGYPAPVANAVEILKAAIDPFAVDAPATVDCRGCEFFGFCDASHPNNDCTDFDKFQAVPPISLTKVTK